MRSVGYILVFGSALLLFFGFRAFLLGRSALGEEMYRFISYARRNIECYMSPLAKNNTPFESAALESVGFLPLIRAGRSPGDAYRTVKDRLVLSREIRVTLDELFLSPSGYHSHEVKSYELAERRIFAELERERVANDEKIKVVAGILFALASGLALIAL